MSVSSLRFIAYGHPESVRRHPLFGVLQLVLSGCRDCAGAACRVQRGLPLPLGFLLVMLATLVPSTVGCCWWRCVRAAKA
jgi:hypothetical protein